MNKIFKALVLLAGVASLASCVKYADYKWAPYASLYLKSATVEESAEGTEFALPVRVYNNSGDCAVTYTIEEVSAKSGENFIPLDNSGVLNFSKDVDSLAIKVKVIGKPGEYTGNQVFKIKLASATNDVTIGTLSTCSVTIKDLDHPLSAMFGEYTVHGVVYTGEKMAYPSWTATMGPVDGDPTLITFSDITAFAAAYGSYIPAGLAVIGKVSDDKKTITFLTPQKVAGTADAWGSTENFILYKHGGVSGEYKTADDSVVFTLNADGQYATEDSYGYSIPSDLAEYPAMFYYYSIIYSDAGAPTYFVKK